MYSNCGPIHRYTESLLNVHRQWGICGIRHFIQSESKIATDIPIRPTNLEKKASENHNGRQWNSIESQTAFTYFVIYLQPLCA